VHDKNSGFCASEQSVGEGKNVEQCAALWTLLLLQSLGVIDSALDVWGSGTLEGKMQDSHFLLAEEIEELLEQAHKNLSAQHQQMLDSEATEHHHSETVWDEAIMINSLLSSTLEDIFLKLETTFCFSCLPCPSDVAPCLLTLLDSQMRVIVTSPPGLCPFSAIAPHDTVNCKVCQQAFP